MDVCAFLYHGIAYIILTQVTTCIVSYSLSPSSLILLWCWCSLWWINNEKIPTWEGQTRNPSFRFLITSHRWHNPRVVYVNVDTAKVWWIMSPVSFLRAPDFSSAVVWQFFFFIFPEWQVFYLHTWWRVYLFIISLWEPKLTATKRKRLEL